MGISPADKSKSWDQSSLSFKDAIVSKIQKAIQPYEKISAQQFQEIINNTLKEAYSICQEIMNIYPQIEAYQNAGWRAPDCFNLILSKQGTPPPPQTVQPSVNQPARRSDISIESIGNELEKGLRELGGAIKEILGSKKKP